MANHLDLEEQEQLDQIKHFWSEYGNLISWVLIIVFGGIAAWNGWQYWQRTQAAQAAQLYDEVERYAQQADLPRLERAVGDMEDRFPRTTFAHQSALLAAKTYVDKGKLAEARTALAWVAEKANDEGYRAVARLRLASLSLDAKAYDEAMRQLSGEFPKAFEGLVADRRGDVLAAQGKKEEAKAEYVKAYKAFDDRTEYRRLLEVKLAALGVDAAQFAPAPAPTASGTAKS